MPDHDPGLVVISGTRLGEYHPLSDGQCLTIGRDTQCDIVLQRASVSREHLKVVRHGDTVTAYDLESRNGAWLGDQVIGKDGVELKDGNLIRIGDAAIKYLDGRSLETSYHERSYQLATRDPLTELHNRLYFMDTLQRVLADRARRGTALALAILDLDHFKTVNDTYGHDVGDEVLRETARILSSNLRRADLLARIGGEEFAVVFSDTGTEKAVSVLQKLNHCLQDEAASEGSAPLVTFSAGIAALLGNPHTSDTVSEDQHQLLKAADDALYRAKNAGRNRVAVANVQTGAQD